MSDSQAVLRMKGRYARSREEQEGDEQEGDRSDKRTRIGKCAGEQERGYYRYWPSRKT